jgi:hypothetical protein
VRETVAALSLSSFIAGRVVASRQGRHAGQGTIGRPPVRAGTETGWCQRPPMVDSSRTNVKTWRSRGPNVWIKASPERTRRTSRSRACRRARSRRLGCGTPCRIWLSQRDPWQPKVPMPECQSGTS